MRRSSKEGPCQEETGRPLGKMIVVEPYYFLKKHYCWARWTAYPPSRLHAVTLSNKSMNNIQVKSVRSKLGVLLLLLLLLLLLRFLVLLVGKFSWLPFET